MSRFQKYKELLVKYRDNKVPDITKHLIAISDIVWALENLNTNRNREWENQLIIRLEAESKGL